MAEQQTSHFVPSEGYCEQNIDGMLVSFSLSVSGLGYVICVYPQRLVENGSKTWRDAIDMADTMAGEIADKMSIRLPSAMSPILEKGSLEQAGLRYARIEIPFSARKVTRITDGEKIVLDGITYVEQGTSVPVVSREGRRQDIFVRELFQTTVADLKQQR
jgi:hypothetical protein